MTERMIFVSSAMMLIIVTTGSCSEKIYSCKNSTEFLYKSDDDSRIFILNPRDEVFHVTGMEKTSSDIGGRIKNCSTPEIMCYSFGPAISIPINRQINNWNIHGAICHFAQKRRDAVRIICRSPDLKIRFGYTLDSRLNLESFYVEPVGGSIASYKKGEKCALPFKNYELEL